MCQVQLCLREWNNCSVASNTVPAGRSNQCSYQSQWSQFQSIFLLELVHTQLSLIQRIVLVCYNRSHSGQIQKSVILLHTAFFLLSRIRGDETLFYQQSCFLYVLHTTTVHGLCGLIAGLCKTILFCCSSCSIIVPCCPFICPLPPLSSSLMPQSHCR